MSNFVSHFVLGLKPELSMHIQQSVICWQSKLLDEILRYAKYWSDDLETRQKKLKERFMVEQTPLAQRSLLRNSGGMRGVGHQDSGPALNMKGVPQGRSWGMPVNQGSDMDIAVLKQTHQCHFCNKLGHWK